MLEKDQHGFHKGKSSLMAEKILLTLDLKNNLIKKKLIRVF